MKDMKDIINKLNPFKTKPVLDPALEATTEEQRRSILDKEKEYATKHNQPWVAVLDTKINGDNIRNGFFELDWNNEFIEKLLDAGYKGESNEQIVDGWFRTIAQNILDEEGLDPTRGAGYINTKNLSEDKSEIS